MVDRISTSVITSTEELEDLKYKVRLVTYTSEVCASTELAHIATRIIRKLEEAQNLARDFKDRYEALKAEGRKSANNER